MDSFVAIDWGTTNRRSYRIEDDRVVATHRDGTGILAVPPGGFPAEIERLQKRYPGMAIVMAGMVGSNRGFVDAGYVLCPADLAMLARAAVAPLADIHIIPGVALRANGRADVMRGEEVQLLGAVASGMAPPDSLLCQPGTHCKWARMANGRIESFVTAMAGELFALLQKHALIGAAMHGEITNGAAFRAGVADAAEQDLLARLFAVRPASLLGLRDDRDAASYVSGLLIGSDCRARLRASGETVYLLADAMLGDLYATAIAACGGRAIPLDSHGAFVAGIIRLRKLMLA